MQLTRRSLMAVAGAAAMAGPHMAGPARAAANPVAGDRLVSIGGVVTEIVFALGAGDRVVAVDSTSTYPPVAQELPDVGYLRQLAAEPIIALAPSLVLLLEDSGPPTTVAQLAAAAVPLLNVPDDASARGVSEKIHVIARAIGREAEGRVLSDGVDDALRRLQQAIAGVKTHPRVLFVLATSGGRLLAAGNGTSAAGIIELAGGRNAVDGFDGYKPLSAEAAVAAEPDLLLFMHQTFEEMGGLDGVAARPELALTPAARTGSVMAMDGLLLLGFGPRTPEAVRELAAALHPAIPLP